MKTTYIEEKGRLSDIVQKGIIGMNTNEERTIIKTPAGSYATRTSLFNSIGYGTDSPLEAAEIGLNLGYRSKEQDNYQSLF